MGTHGRSHGSSQCSSGSLSPASSAIPGARTQGVPGFAFVAEGAEAITGWTSPRRLKWRAQIRARLARDDERRAIEARCFVAHPRILAQTPVSRHPGSDSVRVELMVVLDGDDHGAEVLVEEAGEIVRIAVEQLAGKDSARDQVLEPKAPDVRAFAARRVAG